MLPALFDEKVERFQTMVGAVDRVGVSEFARSKEWRMRLPQSGCFEVVDRNGVVGYLLAPEYAQSLSQRIASLEAQLERAEVAAMFEAREGYTDVRTGTDLKAAVTDAFNERIDELMGIVNGD